MQLTAAAAIDVRIEPDCAVVVEQQHVPAHRVGFQKA